MSRPRAAATCTSFCMCPGGEIIAATPLPDQLCSNGMSRYRRDGAHANAALVVGRPGGPAAFDALDALERAAYALGGGDFTAPAQTARAFLRGETGQAPSSSSYAFGLRAARLDRLFDDAVRDALQAAVRHSARILPGALETGVLVGVETRVSSPVRFARDAADLSSSLPGLHVAGEAAGCAGGIVSAAVDGLRIAETLLVGNRGR